MQVAEMCLGCGRLFAATASEKQKLGLQLAGDGSPALCPQKESLHKHMLRLSDSLFSVETPPRS